MSTEPLDFLRETVPALYAKGVAELEKRASSDALWKKQLDDTLGAAGATHVVLEGPGGGELWMAVRHGKLTAHDSKPTDVPTRLAVAGPADGAKEGLAELLGLGQHDNPEALLRLARATSARAEKLVEKEKIGFHLIIKDVPDFDVVTIKCGVGLEDPPEKPGFTATVSYDSLEDMRAGDITPQQLFMTKTKIVGDATRLITLVMTAMQPIR